jgi:hypothetical protein
LGSLGAWSPRAWAFSASDSFGGFIKSLRHWGGWHGLAKLSPGRFSRRNRGAGAFEFAALIRSAPAGAASDKFATVCHVDQRNPEAADLFGQFWVTFEDDRLQHDAGEFTVTSSYDGSDRID